MGQDGPPFDNQESSDNGRAARPGASLRRNHDFLKLWAGQSISMLGSQVTPIALPLIASILFHATPGQMAFLLAMQYAPYTLVGLFAGALVDRMRRKPLMIAADLGRAALLATLPLAIANGILRMELLYVVSFGMGVLNVFFGTAYGAFLPAIVPREQLVEANSRFSTSSSIAGIAGPGLAGSLVQLLTAPVAILMDAASFLVSALALVRIRTPDPAPPAPERARNIWREIAEGMLVLLRNPILRALQVSMATNDIFWNALYAVYFLFVTRDLRLPAGAIGVIFGAGSAGALLGSLVAARLARRFGLGRTLIVSQICVGSGSLLIACAAYFRFAALPLLIAAEVIQASTNTVFGINRGSVALAVTPAHMRGRVGASGSVIGLGVAAAGVAIGGFLGERLGLAPTIVIGALGSPLAFLWLVFSPIRDLWQIPEPVEAMLEPTAR